MFLSFELPIWLFVHVFINKVLSFIEIHPLTFEVRLSVSETYRDFAFRTLTRTSSESRDDHGDSGGVNGGEDGDDGGDSGVVGGFASQ